MAHNDRPLRQSKQLMRESRRQQGRRMALGQYGSSAGRRPVALASRGSDGSLLEHLASIGAVLLALVFLVKTYAAANYSLTTASALLTTAPISVILGMVTSYEYDVFPLIGLSLLCWSVLTFPRQSRASHFLSFPALAGAFIFLALSPWPSLWPPALVLGIVLVFYGFLAMKLRRTCGARKAAAFMLSSSGRIPSLHQLLRRTLRPPRVNKSFLDWVPSLRATIVYFFVIAGVWIFMASLHSLWLPFEFITVQSSANSLDRMAVVGSVLSSDDTWTTIIKAGNRGLLRYPSDSILARRVCHLNGAQPEGHRPIMDALRHKGYKSPNTGCQTIWQETRNPHLHLVSGSF